MGAVQQLVPTHQMTPPAIAVPTAAPTIRPTGPPREPPTAAPARVLLPSGSVLLIGLFRAYAYVGAECPRAASPRTHHGDWRRGSGERYRLRPAALRRTSPQFPQRVSRLAAARALTRAARRCSKTPTRVFGRACAWELVVIAIIAAERSAVTLAADSTAAPSLGQEVSSCTGLLREEVGDQLDHRGERDRRRSFSLSCCCSSCSSSSPRSRRFVEQRGRPQKRGPWLPL